jgi:phosphate uptake regulator
MQRKIIKQGNGSYTITLPAKWIKEQHISDEVTVTMSDATLVIKNPLLQTKKTITFDATNFSKINVRQYLSGLYRDGFEEIVIMHVDTTIAKEIKSCVKNFIELDIISQNNTTYTLAMLSEPDPKQFPVIFRKLFQIIAQSCEHLEQGSFQEVIELTEQYRKYDNFVRRQITTNQIKKGISYQSVFIHLLQIQTTANRLAENKIKAKFDLMHEVESSFFSEDSKRLAKITTQLKKNTDSFYSKKQISRSVLGESEITRLTYSLCYPLLALLIPA